MDTPPGPISLISFQNAKQEMQILEDLKTLALEIFNVTSQIKHAKQKKAIFDQYQSSLDYISS